MESTEIPLSLRECLSDFNQNISDGNPVLPLLQTELCSAVSFSGGTYGLARVVLGFYSGFMIGTLELLEYTLMATASIVESCKIV